MSGSPSFPPSGPRGGDCNIVERTPLNSPKSSVLKQLSKGDLLDVEVSADGRSLVAKSKHGLAGSLTPLSLAELLECIETGKKYAARIVDLKGAYCELEIRPK